MRFLYSRFPHAGQGTPDKPINPTREEVVKAVRPHLCRCTGYVKLVDAILDAATLLPEGNIPEPDDNPRLGSGWPKYGGYERAVGTRPFVNDIDAPGMAHGAIVFSEHPRARVLAIHTDEAADMPGVVRILTADDIPGERVLGLYAKDWPVYIKVGEVTRYIGDALACVVAEPRPKPVLRRPASRSIMRF